MTAAACVLASLCEVTLNCFVQWANTSLSSSAKGKKRGVSRAKSPAASTIPSKPSVLKHFCQRPKKHALAQVSN